MLNGPVWLHCKTVPLVDLAFGTLASVATGGGGPMQSGGFRKGTPSSSLARNVASRNGPDVSFGGGKDGRYLLGHSAEKCPVWRHTQHWYRDFPFFGSVGSAAKHLSE